MLMKKIIIGLLALSNLFFWNLHAQENDLQIYNNWAYYGDVSNVLYEQIRDVAFSQINERANTIANLNGQEDWLNRQKEIKGKLKQVMGQFPERTPLNTKITGRIEKEDFSVEKIVFESRPGFLVSAAVFAPKKKGKKPAILYCCGHSETGFRGETYQHIIINLVKKGFVVLAFDPIGQGERYQYFDEKGVPLLQPTHEHSYPGAQLFVSGTSIGNYFIWDGIRAVDYLLTRKDVDPGRIGITGRSGGGTQSAYIAAIDERIAAAAPECYITSFELLLRSKGPQDAEQNFADFLKEGLEMGDFLEARAPKPTLIVSTTRDFFSIQGARNTFKEAQQAFNAFGQPDNLAMTEDDAGHASTRKNREAVYSFFRKHLNNPGSSNDEEVEYFDEKELWNCPTGQVTQTFQSETLFSLNKSFSDKQIMKLREERERRNDYSEIIQKAICLSGYEKTSFTDDYIFSGRIQQKDYVIEKYLVKGNSDYHIPVLRLLPAKAIKERILLLDDKGKNHAANLKSTIELVNNGYELFIPDLSGIGELGGGYTSGDAIIDGVALNVWFAGLLTRKSPLSLNVEEIEKLNSFIRKITDSSKLSGIGYNTLCPTLIHAAAILDCFDSLLLVEPLTSYASIVQEHNYKTKFIPSSIAGVLEEYDLPDLIASISHRKITIVNPVNALDHPINETVFDTDYSGVKAYCRKKGTQNNLIVRFNLKDIDSELLK